MSEPQNLFAIAVASDADGVFIGHIIDPAAGLFATREDAEAYIQSCKDGLRERYLAYVAEREADNEQMRNSSYIKWEPRAPKSFELWCEENDPSMEVVAMTLNPACA